ncbi:serine hydrolase domain-containing protein [uncultured Jatrophihabitans sp.]|uniref:serine hydrolase domain-containing protein n=1 Tax=uncultured Jatrophihabitans sp. TaxID=1610747 RepID=UPI0035CB54BD
MARVPVGGDVDPGWEPVLQEFTRNFERRGEVGAAVAVFRHGRPVVDLWGGRRDATRDLPWKRDTLVPVFSTTKGVAALVVASLRSRGHLEYDAPVAKYWPEFAQHGKDELTVRQLLAHEAGLAVLDRPVHRSELFDLDALATVLAEQRPAWPPGTRHGYHAMTLGLFQNELVRRTDPEGRTLGQVLAEDIVKPLGLAFFVGLPERIEMDRVAVLGRLARPDVLRQLPAVPWALALQLVNPRSATAQSMRTPNLGAAERFSRREVLAPEVASSNGVGDGRSLAALYSAAAGGSPALPIDADTLAELAQPVRGPVQTDVLLKARRTFSLGFSKPVPDFAFGSPGGRAFGTCGYGGSFAFADPDTGIGYAYVTNRLGVRLDDDPREVALRRAVYRCAAGC